MTNGLTISKTIFNLLDKKSLLGQFQGGCRPNDLAVQLPQSKRHDSPNDLAAQLGHSKCFYSPIGDSLNVKSPLGYSPNSSGPDFEVDAWSRF